jgi:hypothetical protein
MERRTVRRVKRRITCEFFYQDRDYKGIVLDLDSTGLFIRTNATIPPGVEIDIHMAASMTAPTMTVRARIARRRSVPANLSSIVNRGLGVRVLEAPPEYGLLLGVGLLDSPVHNRFASNTTMQPLKHHSPDVAASRPNRAPLPPPEAQPIPSPPVSPKPVPRRPIPARTPQTTSSPTIGVNEDDAPENSPAPARAQLVGGAELNEIADLLVEFGVDVIHQEPTDPEFEVLDDARLVVVSARFALEHTIPDGAEASVSIAVCDDASKTIGSMLEKRGFDYLLRQPVHAQALRLLFRYALFDQPDRRTQLRRPFGCDVSWRIGWRRESGALLEISRDGCRLLAAEAPTLDARIRIKIPRDVAGGQALRLRGSVVRCSRHQSGDPLESAAVGVAFDEMSPKVRDQLAHFYDLWSAGPPPLHTSALAESGGSDSDELKTDGDFEGTNFSDSETPVVEQATEEEVVAEGCRDEDAVQQECRDQESADDVVVLERRDEETADDVDDQEAHDEETVVEVADPECRENDAVDEVAESECRQGEAVEDEMTPTSTDRRQHRRGRWDQEIVEVDTEQHVVQALLGRDLSMGGIRIDPQESLDAGDKIQIAIFDTTRHEPLVLHAVVARDYERAGMGLHFVDLSEENEARLVEMTAGLPALESLGSRGNPAAIPAGILSHSDEDPSQHEQSDSTE